MGRAPALPGHAQGTPAQVGVSWPGQLSGAALCSQTPENTLKNQLRAPSLSPVIFRHLWHPKLELLSSSRGRCSFLAQSGQSLHSKHGNDFLTIKAEISPLSPSQDSPCPSSPPVGCTSLPAPLSLSPFHLPNSQTSPELHLCLHLRAYLLCSHPGLHPCPFPYHPDFTHTTPWLLPCPPASSHRSPGARARSCSTPKLPYWDFLG